MVRSLYNDGTVPGKELLETTQPPHFDCTILGEDQQRWQLLLQGGKWLFWFFGNGPEHIFQEKVEVGAQETEQGRTNQLDHRIDLVVALKRPGETRQDDHGTEPFGSASNHSQRDRPRHVVT